MNDSVEDPLRPLADLLLPDKRNQYFRGTLEELHARLSVLELNGNVPTSARQLFETAKNVSLYAWFVYRFHQVSEMTAYAALELALRIRAGESDSFLDRKKKRPPSLRDLLEKAMDERWISPTNFSAMRSLAAIRAADNIVRETIRGLQPGDEAVVRYPSEAEIAAELGKMDVSTLLRSIPDMRNDLGHGSTTLSNSSVGTLQIVAEIMNQIFADPN
ncbi:hypothetical protein [Solimonas flava]|uniref:hypothetical protein n=1 Tax=Solimonas flava TaxID=415849 RepID=UPI000484AF0A|nr:hypothetical protein [Solimonas flava]